MGLTATMLASTSGFIPAAVPSLRHAAPYASVLRSAAVKSSVARVGKMSVRMNLQLKDELMGKERLMAEEASIKEMETKGMAKKEVSLTDIISMWVTNIILTYGDPEKYASLQDGAVKSEVLSSQTTIHVSSYYYFCPHNTIYVSSYHSTVPPTTMYSSYYYMRPHIYTHTTMYVSSYIYRAWWRT